MKQSIHPTYYSQAAVSCACGNTATIGSTIQTISVELCSKCHPFYTGTQKLVDTAGRVERFKQRSQKKETISVLRKGRKVKRARSASKKNEA